MKKKELFSSKKFKHDFLSPVVITQVNSPSGRTYTTPEGESYRSVTTFLADTSDQSFLVDWRLRVGDEEAERISKRATDRGSKFHAKMESLLINEAVEDDTVSLPLKKMTPVLDKIDNIRLIEGQLYSDVLKLAGTVDLVADYEGVPSIIDWKTSGKPKEEYDIENYFLQALIYSLMVEERYGLRYDQLVVVIAVEFDNPQVFKCPRKKLIKSLSYRLKLRENAS